MSHKVPIVRPIAWISVIPQIGFMTLLAIVFSLFVSPFIYALIIGMWVYLLLSFLLKIFVPRNHRKGIALTKNGEFSAAILEYEKSYEFFNRYPWIDRYRFITLLSASSASYAEMALLNIAFSYGQIGNGEKSKEYYQKTLELYPDSMMAKSAMKMIASFEIPNIEK
ncbi:MAG: tetratricopeptide repeat protein [Saccharofermentanales bacterium]